MHTRLVTLPPGLPEIHRDIFAMTHYTYWCGLVVHCGFLVLFLRLGLHGLALFNVASILVYLGNLALSRRRQRAPPRDLERLLGTPPATRRRRALIFSAPARLTPAHFTPTPPRHGRHQHPPHR